MGRPTCQVTSIRAPVRPPVASATQGDLWQIPPPATSGRIRCINPEVPVKSPVRPPLACGLAAPVLFLATDLLAIARSAGYSPMRQSISELTAVGAPTRALVTVLHVTRDALLVAFGGAVTSTAGDSRVLAATGRLVAANAALDAFATAAVPRDYASPTWAPRNTANTMVMAAGVGCFVAAMGAGAVALRGPFRAFSAGIPLSYGLLTALSLLLRPRDELPSSTGTQERTMAYSYQVWVAVLASLLLRRRSLSRTGGLS